MFFNSSEFLQLTAEFSVKKLLILLISFSISSIDTSIELLTTCAHF